LTTLSEYENDSHLQKRRDKAVSLWDLKEDENATIERLGSGIESRHQIRMQELGIHPGSNIQCLKRIPFGGPRVYQVGGCVFSIARDIASHIDVRKTT
jgi:Fe2+ transport system protein FeoA